MAAWGGFCGAIRYREPTGNSALARARHNARATAGAQISVPSNDPSWHGPPFAALPQTKADQHRWLSGLGPAEYDFDLGSADLRAIKPGDDPKNCVALTDILFMFEHRPDGALRDCYRAVMHILRAIFSAATYIAVIR